MKKIYLTALCLISTVLIAQQTISFESTDGFTTGNIHGQGTWISTPTGGVPPNVVSQLITEDKASHGSKSLKIVKETDYGWQNSPIIGAFNNLGIPLAYTNFTVSFDINISEMDGSVFGFQAVNTGEEKLVVRMDFNEVGAVKVLNTVSGVIMLDSSTAIWSPNTWYRFKVVGSATDIKYYLNNTLIYTGTAVSELPIDQLRFVHDNNEGSAYIDHIKINIENTLSTKEINVKDVKLKIYPNPSTDFITIDSRNKIKNVEIYDIAGKKIQVKSDGNRVDIRNLSSGIYLLNVETEVQNFTEKFIKK